MTEHKWFHGGFPGLAAGDLLLPPDESDTPRTLSEHARQLGAPHGIRRDRVYLTRVQNVARVFAAMYPDGALYAVDPDGDMEADPDAPDIAAMAARARITAVIRPRVVFAHRHPDSWFRMLTTAVQETRR